MPDQTDNPPEGSADRPAKARNRGGRPPGAKNKSTLERERREQLERERLALLDGAKADQAEQALVAAQARGVKLAKDVIQDFMRLFAGMAATYQPLPPGQEIPPGKIVDEGKFEKYAALAVDAAARLAPFESPRYSAVLVGSSVVNRVEVTGGMPDDFAAPAGVPTHALPPGTIIEAEEDYVPPAAATG